MAKLTEDVIDIGIVAGLLFLGYAVIRLSKVKLPDLKMPTLSGLANVPGLDWTNVLTPNGTPPTAQPGTGWNDGTGNGAPLSSFFDWSKLWDESGADMIDDSGGQDAF